MLSLIYLLVLGLLVPIAQAGIFEFFTEQHQQRQQQDNGRHPDPFKYEEEVMGIACNKYLCPDTLICVDAPKFCPCPFPSSQLRCFLPNGRHVCISKPAGDEFAGVYDDVKTNWKVDAKDDNVRDCGWVNRAWRGVV